MEHKEILHYLVTNKSGYLIDLENTIGKDNVNGLALTGYISIGTTQKQQTWKALNLAYKNYELYYTKLTLAEKISGLIYHYIFGIK